MHEVEKGSANVYADLDLPDAGEMLAKAQLASEIGRIIKGHGWTQQEAANVLGMPQSRLSKILRGQFRRISLERLASYRMKLSRIGVSR